MPVCFELTILFSALGSVFGMLGLNRLPQLYHWVFGSEQFKRVTDDRFFISIEVEDPKFEGARALLEKTHPISIEAVALAPVRGDFNDDLRGFGIGAVRAGLRAQLRPEDVERFLPRSVRRGGDRSR